jgi:aerobic carbon-monoxide dehydrogenase large subunit
LIVGESPDRKEDPRLISGKGNFTIDVKLPGTLYVTFLRSPYAHARIRSTNIRKSTEDNFSVFFDGDFGKDLPILSSWPGTPEPPFPLLARGEVLYCGQLVAAVVAPSPGLAEDGLEFVEVDYETLPAILDSEDALKPDSVLVHSKLKSNVIGSWASENGSYEGAVSKADLVIEEKFSAQRVTGQAIEPRGAVASWDKAREKLIVWLTTQCPHVDRKIISECTGLPEDRIQVLSNDVGGGFGINSHSYPEQILTCLLSIQLGRPIKWTEDRREHVSGAIHSGDCTQWISLAATKDGMILGMKEKILQNAGAYLQTRHVVSTFVTALLVPGPYRIPCFSIEVSAVFSNKGPVGTYRAFGMTQATFARERIIDILARKLGMDPAEVRMKNLIEPDAFPYINPSGLPYDSGNYKHTFSKALELAGYREFRQTHESRKRNGKRSGIGIGFYLEMGGVGALHMLPTKGSNYAPNESARIRLYKTGRVKVFTGVAPTGQGLETTLAQIAAEELGVPLSSVDIVHGDTETCPYSGDGTIASRSANMSGNAVFLASKRLKRALEDRVRMKLGLNQGSPISLENETILAQNRIVSLDELFGETPFIEETEFYVPQTTSGTTAYGIQIANVDIDEDTGKIKVSKLTTVHDCGRMLNPAIVEGMTQGGCAQGVSASLLEEVAYGDDGSIISTTFGDYLIPTALEMPELASAHTVTLSPTNPLGVKGGGEGGIIGAPAAIANAVCDAYSSDKLSLSRMIARPETLFFKIRKLEK